jgi:hypothetical protein
LEITESFRYWSDVNSWPTKVLPVENDTVEIEPGWNMVLDLAETPKLKMLIVNGRLSFKNDTDIHLRCTHIFVRVGELIIGYKEKPFSAQAKITLFGEKDSRAMVFDNAVEAGNKVISNIGIVKMFGTARSTKMTRLLAPAQKGDLTITVEKNLDLKAGDKIALASTSFSYHEGEDADITAYDSLTGVVTVTMPVLFYHWGKAESTMS